LVEDHQVKKEAIIEELRRVATVLNLRSVSRSAFDEHATISSRTVEESFGSWNEGVSAAGLMPLPQGGIPRDEQRRLERLTSRPAMAGATGRIADEALLDEILRLEKLLGRRPSGNQITAKGKYHSDVYRRRWGSVAAAHKAALERKSD
jgi:HNH endonuclease